MNIDPGGTLQYSLTSATVFALLQPTMVHNGIEAFKLATMPGTLPIPWRGNIIGQKPLKAEPAIPKVHGDSQVICHGDAVWAQAST